MDIISQTKKDESRYFIYTFYALYNRIAYMKIEIIDGNPVMKAICPKNRSIQDWQVNIEHHYYSHGHRWSVCACTHEQNQYADNDTTHL